METLLYPNNKDLFRLPWSLNESPIGWVEVTDICNIHCKGCYRLNKSGHKPFEKIKEEILFLKKWRNCDTITLAGGEAILHPKINDIIVFINENGMKSMIITNGVALNEKLLMQLKKSGLTGVSFHIDSTQNRPEIKNMKDVTELNLNPVRLHYAKLVANVGELTTSFGITVDNKNIDDIPLFVNWAIDNINFINTLTFIVYRGFPVSKGIEYYANGEKVEVKKNSLGYAITEKDFNKITIKSQDVYSTIKKHFPNYNANSYLGGTNDHKSIKWLIGNIILNTKGKMFGSYGNKSMEFLQSFYHFKTGRYLVHLKKNIFGKKIFFLSIIDKQVRKSFVAFTKYIIGNPLRIFVPLKALNIGIVQPPDFLADGNTDMCDGCPDMCVFEGKLVNSCRLDECLKFGSLIQFHVKDKTIANKLANLN